MTFIYIDKMISPPKAPFDFFSELEIFVSHTLQDKCNFRMMLCRNYISNHKWHLKMCKLLIAAELICHKNSCNCPPCNHSIVTQSGNWLTEKSESFHLEDPKEIASNSEINRCPPSPPPPPPAHPLTSQHFLYATATHAMFSQ